MNNILPGLMGELVLTKEKVLPEVLTFKTGDVTLETGVKALVKVYEMVVGTVDTADSVRDLSFLASPRFGRLVILRSRRNASLL